MRAVILTDQTATIEPADEVHCGDCPMCFFDADLGIDYCALFREDNELVALESIGFQDIRHERCIAAEKEQATK